MKYVKWFGLIVLAVVLMQLAFRVIMPTGNENVFQLILGWMVCWTGAGVWNHALKVFND